MQKIPTLFRRDPDDMKRILPEVNPECQWVLDGDGTATRKYDGTCVALLYTDGDQVSTEPPTSGPSTETVDLRWFARREVKPGKQAPANYIPISTDENTGKTVGWEPVGQSAFAKFHAQALASMAAELAVSEFNPGTYELIGVKVNGNPERIDEEFGHQLMSHARAEVLEAPRDHDGLRDWLLAHPEYEGIVWHNSDGRMSKVKRRDFTPC